MAGGRATHGARLPVLTKLLIGCGASLVVGWLTLLALLLASRAKRPSAVDSVRVFPDTLRLAVSMYRDRTLPASVRRRLRIALIYPIQPFNLIPNFIPLIGSVDTLLVLAWALRSSIRIVGPEAIVSHWKGSADSLTALHAVLRLPAPATRVAG
jgi:uncharacterized membrane protein YkvA (DUF1232 family)